jgi:hypothetical protein
MVQASAGARNLPYLGTRQQHGMAVELLPPLDAAQVDSVRALRPV